MILRLTRRAAARLSGAATGRVHSVYSGTINLEMTSGDFVTLHGPGPLRAPFAAACDRLPGTAWRGAQVRHGAEGLAVGPWLLRFDAARVTAAPSRPESDGRTVLARLPVVEATIPRLAEGATALGRAIRLADPEALAVAGRALIGLGPGLTPSGDDCLVGALAALWCHGDGWGERLSRLGPSLATAARTATTRVAAEFVACAANAEFSEPLWRAVATGDAADLLAFGATSGRDTVFGIRTALAALAPPRPDPLRP